MNFDINLLFCADATFRVNELSLDSSGNFASRNLTFSQLLDVATVVQQTLENSSISHGIVGVSVNKSALFVAVIIGVLKSNNSFVALDSEAPIEYLLTQCARFRTACVFSAQLSNGNPDFHQIHPSLYFVKFNRKDRFTFGTETRILYVIQTSGSTGEPKIVLVPDSAILPNIEDFANRFSITYSDSIFFSTSLSFDPSMVELFLAIFTGSELVIPPPPQRLSKSYLPGSTLVQILTQQFRLSFIQLTPAVLQRLPPPTLQHLFGPNSPFKNLLVGGDVFPINLVHNYLNARCPMRIFNVYGVTEVSCWATCHKLKLSPNEFLPRAVPIGDPLRDTRLSVSSDNRLQIIGRKCMVDFEWSAPEHTQTEDLVDVVRNEHSDKVTIFVRGRFKPNSVLPSYELESVVLSAFPEVVFAKLVYAHNCRFLFLNHFDDTSTLPTTTLRAKIPQRLWPTRVFWNVRVNYLTNNGKVDEEVLIDFVRRSFYGDDKFLGNLAEFLQFAYGISAEDFSLSRDKVSLRVLGIGSIEAAEIAYFLCQSLCDCHNDSESNQLAVDTMQFVLDEGHSLRDFLKFSQRLRLGAGCTKCEKKRTKVASNPKSLPQIKTIKCLSMVLSSLRFDTELCWSSNLGKCIDASPVLSDDGVVYVGSHAGSFRGLSLSDGQQLLDYCRDTRFEASCAISGRFMAVGGFDGVLLIFDRANSHKICFEQDTGSEIRMAPVFDADSGALFCGSYDGWMWRIARPENDAGNWTLVGHFDVTATGHGALRSSPLIWPKDNLLLVGTLGGYVIAMDKSSGKFHWTQKVDSPLFANLIAIPGTEFCCATSVLGTVYALEVQGQIKSSIQLKQSLFDAPTIFRDSDRTLLLLGSNVGQLFVLEFTSECELIIIRNVRASSDQNLPILRSLIIIDDFLSFATTNGSLYRLLLSALLQESEDPVSIDQLLKLDAETFGQPLVIPDSEQQSAAYTVVIGARDDLLRCFSIRQAK